jgi:hypothetical protein
MSLPLSKLNDPGGERDTGGILWFPEALERYPDAKFVVYNRVSSWGQAGKGKVLLEAKTDAVVDEVYKLAPKRIRRIVRGIEEGKLSKPRPKLIEATRSAVVRGLLVVTSDLSRYIRPEAFCHRTNREAWPTPEEFDVLRKRTGGAILTTLAHPSITESQRGSLATKRGNPGRPSTMTPELAIEILHELGSWHPFAKRWETSVRAFARRVGVTQGLVQRLLSSPVPAQCCDGRVGVRWVDFTNPALQYRLALDKGLIPNRE